ncbi:11048_t:CDS:10 [Ambispora leptoticha]|uniref:11048_t:CDS:1 n=1 Tax=Ambispora leptoticha TaxID=144679 RepID=A0A9N9AQC5_9GLOM|nr:11048_t:CDS:10 [Ambispora leptoticha]
MARETNLSIDTAAAARGIQKSSAHKKSEDDVVEEGEIEEEDDLASSPDIPDENIDFDRVYALHNFAATVDGQASVEKDEPLTLMDDSNSYWWLVKVLRTDSIGYIPADNIETPNERLARLYKHKNINLSSSLHNGNLPPAGIPLKKNNTGEPHQDEYEEETEIERSGRAGGGKEEIINNEAVEPERSEEYHGPNDGTRTSEDHLIFDGQQQRINQSFDESQQFNNHNGAIPIIANNSLLANQSPSSQNIIMNNNMNIVQEHSGGPDPNQPPKKSDDIDIRLFQQTNETKKITLTPPLHSERSDFLDMSDDDDDAADSNSKASKFFGIGESDSKKKVSMDDIIKDLPPEQKSKKKEKKEGGILKKLFFKRKNSKKEEENKSSTSNTAVAINVSVKNSIEPSQQPLQNHHRPPTQPSLQQQRQQSPQINNQSTYPQGPQIRYPQQPQPQTPSPQPQSPTKTTPLSPLTSVFRIFAGQNIQTNIESKTILLNNLTTASDLIRQSLTRFKLDNEENWENYYISVRPIHGEIINLMPDEHPLEIYNSFNTSPLPTIRRASNSSISSNVSTVSNHQTIKALNINEYVQRSSVQIYLNKKLTQRNSYPSGEKRLRVHILIYADDLPPQLRKGTSVPRTSMSVPKHLADKAARRRSHGEEGKPKEKVLLVNGRATVRDVIEKALDKFGITEALVDDDEDIEGDYDGKLRYKLMLISEGEEIALSPNSQVISVFPSTPNFQHSSIDSIESASSLTAPDYNPDEPIFVLRQKYIDEHQRYALPNIIIKSKAEQAKSHPAVIDSRENSNDNNRNHYYPNDQPSFSNPHEINNSTTVNSGSIIELPSQLEKIEEILTRKQLIEQQREYSRAKQRSILSAHKNSEKGVDIVTSVGSIRSSRIFGSKVRYSFIPKEGEQFDISDIIEDIWGENLGEEQNSDGTQSIPRFNFIPAEEDELEENAPLFENVSVDSSKHSKKEKRLSTRNTDILEVIVDSAKSNDKIVNQVVDDKIEQVLQKVTAGQHANGNIPSPTSVLDDQKLADSNLMYQAFDNFTREQSSSQLSLQNNNIPSHISNPNDIESHLDSSSNSTSTLPTSDKGFTQNLDSSPRMTPTQPQSSLHSPSKKLHGRKRSPSNVSNNSVNITNSSQDALPPMNTASSLTENDWILSDDFGLQELLILVRSGVSMIEQKERRRSGWRLYDDPEKVLEQINPAEFREEIKSVFANVNKELDDIENQLDLIMDDALCLF